MINSKFYKLFSDEDACMNHFKALKEKHMVCPEADIKSSNGFRTGMPINAVIAVGAYRCARIQCLNTASCHTIIGMQLYTS